MLWEQWLVDYGRMDKDNFYSFSDFKKKVLSQDTSKNNENNSISAKEAIKMAEKIKKADQGKGR